MANVCSDLSSRSQMLGNPPITIKKPRGPSAKKKTDDSGLDFSAEFTNVERDLNKHRIGTFQVYYKDMTFEWSEGGPNRAIASEGQQGALLQSMISGVHRHDYSNRMTGVVDKMKLEGHIFPGGMAESAPRVETSVSWDGVKAMNEKAQYPIVLNPNGTKPMIEMQSGHHRMELLRQLYPQPKDHWWIVTLYDAGKTY
jgi:hypothetical protein